MRKSAGRVWPLVVLLWLGAPSSSPGAEAKAGLALVAERVANEWRSAGGTPVRLPPRFLVDDETVHLVLPEAGEGSCTSVAVVGARGLSFHARLSGDEEDGAAEGRATSVAGALSFVRCGEARPTRVSVTSDAGRGAIEVIVARSQSPLPSLRTVLPERTGGPVPLAPEPGDLPSLGTPDKRADAAEARARREAKQIHPRKGAQAGPDGMGRLAITLTPGCHKLELFALEVRRQRAGRKIFLDLDAEIRDAGTDRLLARDRTDAPDAHVGLCVGEAAPVVVVFAGAPPDSNVTVSHVSTPLPSHLPGVWGAEALARMATALSARHLSALTEMPMLLAQGGAGHTTIPLRVHPGACYLAVVSVVQGMARGIGLRAVVGARDAQDDRGVSDSAGLVAFCAGPGAGALLEVDARGASLGWGLAMFRIASGPEEGVR